jgi:sulfatase-like protein
VHQRTFRRVPVVLVVFDELPVSSLMTRRGHIDRRLFPNFARLAEDSVWFRNASAVAVLTHTTIPALLTGRYQNLQGPPPATYPRNLFTLIGRDYHLMAVPPDPRLCPPRRCSTREQRLPPAGSRFGDFGGSLRGENFRGFLRLLRPRERPALYYLHLVAPHTPWSFLPSGVRYQPDRRPAGELEVPGPGRAWGPNPWLAAQAQQQHLLQTRLVDRLVGALVDRLRRESMYERSLLIVTVDHGMAFEAGLPKRDPRKPTVGEIAYVPLFVKRPFETEGRVSDRPVELVDIVPTIADILQLPRVWKRMDGISVFSPEGYRARERALYDVELTVGGSEKFTAIAHNTRDLVAKGTQLICSMLLPATWKSCWDEPSTTSPCTVELLRRSILETRPESTRDL